MHCNRKYRDGLCAPMLSSMSAPFQAGPNSVTMSNDDFLNRLQRIQDASQQIQPASQPTAKRASAPAGRPFSWIGAVFAILGLGGGALAAVLMFTGAGLNLIEPPARNSVGDHFRLLAVVLQAMAIFLWLLGRLFNVDCLRRVLLHFLLSGFVIYAALHAFRVNILEWPQLIEQLKEVVFFVLPQKG
jgi:hypothetical protein